jgi:hypothetical protein
MGVGRAVDVPYSVMRSSYAIFSAPNWKELITRRILPESLTHMMSLTSKLTLEPCALAKRSSPPMVRVYAPLAAMRIVKHSSASGTMCRKSSASSTTGSAHLEHLEG